MRQQHRKTFLFVIMSVAVVICLVLCTLYRSELAIQYHCFWLSRESGYLQEVLEMSSDSTGRKALSVYAGTTDGQKQVLSLALSLTEDLLRVRAKSYGTPDEDLVDSMSHGVLVWNDSGLCYDVRSKSLTERGVLPRSFSPHAKWLDTLYELLRIPKDTSPDLSACPEHTFRILDMEALKLRYQIVVLTGNRNGMASAAVYDNQFAGTSIVAAKDEVAIVVRSKKN
jgi:hypothetical protein